MLLFFSCAQIVNPGGGPIDKVPPHVVKYIPDSAALNFKAKEIHVFFNEYIKLKDISNQLIISPPLKHTPDVIVKGKELIIELTDTLRPDATYTFNFGSAVADNTEGNSLENFQYVFSTGSFIDSLSVKGTIKDALTLTPEKGMLVMLYDLLDDSVPLKKLPVYFTKTKDDGSYKIGNVHEGRYKIFALRDVNANYLYDSPEETIAFSDTLVEVSKNRKVDLLSFKELPKKQFIKRRQAMEHGHMQIIFNKPVNDLGLTPTNFIPPDTAWKIEEYSKKRDTVDIWLPNFKRDSLRMIISDDKKILDTVDLRIPPPPGKRFRLNLAVSPVSGLVDLNKKIELQFNHPLSKFGNKALITILRDSVHLTTDSLFYGNGSTDRSILLWLGHSYTERSKPLNGKGSGALDKKNGGEVRARVVDPWMENSSYKIIVPPGLFTDIFDLKNDSIKIDFKTREQKFYGTLKLSPKLPADNEFIIQLLDEKGNILQSNKGVSDESINYEYLAPGNYRLRLVYNTTANEMWDTGNYFQHLQPEKVIYSVSISIRSNWDMEQKWEVKE